MRNINGELDRAYEERFVVVHTDSNGQTIITSYDNRNSLENFMERLNREYEFGSRTAYFPETKACDLEKERGI